MRKAKIICTVGPASLKPDILDRMIAGGMDAARLNFSHGTHDSHAQAIRMIREAAKRRHATVAILQDLQGPRIRIGSVAPEGVTVTPGQRVRLIVGNATADPRAGIHDGARSVSAGYTADIPVSYPSLTKDVQPGARVLIDDGLIELTAEKVTAEAVDCAVVRGGRVTSHKGVNLPGTRISAPALTDKDREDLRFGVAQEVDYVALSFVRGPEDILAAKGQVSAAGGDHPVIAKIERPEAIHALDAVIEQADGVMVARGDLGVEMGPEAVPVLQKRIIAAANRRRRLVITATQMLESMTQHPTPTRAEASDVANAVFDGTDAVMLSAETAAGRYPVEAVQVMDRIVQAAEEGKPLDIVRRSETPPGQYTVPEASCAAAFSAALAIGAQAIVVFSESGATARLMAKLHPQGPIIAYTPNEPTRRRMALYWGVTPRMMAHVDQPDERVQEVERRLKADGFVKSGDRIVILSGTLSGRRGGTNAIQLHQVT
jgi:pyruvate kinase